MTINYTVHKDQRFMTHNARRMSYETICDGCDRVLTDPFVEVVTDRSGSEQAAVHDLACADFYIERETGESE